MPKSVRWSGLLEQFDEALGERGRISDPLARALMTVGLVAAQVVAQGQDQPSEAPAAQAAADSEPSKTR